jgi:hypothetical protein
VAWNREDANSCWAAIAYIVYGRGEYWPWVKAQHSLWIDQVMSISGHPNIYTYSHIIPKCSVFTCKNGTGLTAVRGRSNRPLVSEMSHVTADLYDIYLVIFNLGYTVEEGFTTTCTFTTRGSRNAPHKFIQVTQGIEYGPIHYQPMRPNVTLPSMYHFAEFTTESLEALKNIPGTPTSTGVKRRWQYEHSTYGLADQFYLHPRPIIPLPSEADLTSAIGRYYTGTTVFNRTWISPRINIPTVEFTNK